MRQSIAHELMWFEYDERRERRIPKINVASGYKFKGPRGLFEELDFARFPND